MNTQTQFRAAYVVSLFSGVVGLITIGMGFGLWLSVQTTLSAGCRTTSLAGALSTCQQAMQVMGNRATASSLLGILLVAVGGGGLYYLREQVP